MHDRQFEDTAEDNIENLSNNERWALIKALNNEYHRLQMKISLAVSKAKKIDNETSEQ